MRKKSDLQRLTLTCASVGRPWIFHASIFVDEMTFVITSLQDEHTCVKPLGNKNSNSTAKWVIGKLKD